MADAKAVGKTMSVGEYCSAKMKILHQEPPRLRGVARFGAPVRIHPLYKFCRWGALFAGITYGLMRNKFLQRRADKFKELRDKKKAERLHHEAEARTKQNEDDVLNLEAVTGSKFY